MMDLVLQFDSSKYVHQLFDLSSAALISTSAGGDIQNFIDIESQTANINNQDFIDFITQVRELSTPLGARRLHPISINANENSREAGLSREHLFLRFSSSYPQYFLSIDNLLFEGNTPIVNHRGELIVSNWMSFGLSASTTQGQRQAAWEFIRFMQNPENVTGTAMMVPTYRPLFHQEIERSVLHIDGAILRNGWQFAESRRQSIDDAIALFEDILEMPMVDDLALPWYVMYLIWEQTALFYEGLITAEQLAVDLQNQITLILMERDW